MNVVRWKFLDVRTNEEHTVELNPNTASSYRFDNQFDFAGNRGVRGRRNPVEWTFGGVVRKQGHHDSLIDWQRHPGKVRVTDHLGRTFEVMIRSLDMRDRRPAGDDTWRFEYTFNCLLLRRVA